MGGNLSEQFVFERIWDKCGFRSALLHGKRVYTFLHDGWLMNKLLRQAPKQRRKAQISHRRFKRGQVLRVVSFNLAWLQHKVQVKSLIPPTYILKSEW